MRERTTIGHTDDGHRVVENENGDRFTITNEDYTELGGMFEGNHASTDQEVEEAEKNG